LVFTLNISPKVDQGTLHSIYASLVSGKRKSNLSLNWLERDRFLCQVYLGFKLILMGHELEKKFKGTIEDGNYSICDR
jgi:hypothetical protein